MRFARTGRSVCLVSYEFDPVPRHGTPAHRGGTFYMKLPHVPHAIDDDLAAATVKGRLC